MEQLHDVVKTGGLIANKRHAVIQRINVVLHFSTFAGVRLQQPGILAAHSQSFTLLEELVEVTLCEPQGVLVSAHRILQFVTQHPCPLQKGVQGLRIIQRWPLIVALRLPFSQQRPHALAIVAQLVSKVGVVGIDLSQLASHGRQARAELRFSMLRTLQSEQLQLLIV